MNFESIKYIYFVGVGGIGMSALARYFCFMGKKVAGYDRTPTELTRKLETEGIAVHYSAEVACIPSEFLSADKSEILVVYTPAVGAGHAELEYFRANGYTLAKRSQVLGLITQASNGIAIAGTHGKTSVTTCVSHLLRSSGIGCSAFLGGISKNYHTNFLFDGKSPWVAIEADEYDRSFLTLSPKIALITSMDADHLDIYGAHDAIEQAFVDFTGKIVSGGTLIHKFGLSIANQSEILKTRGVTVLTYSLDNPASDFHAANLTIQDGNFVADICYPGGTMPRCIFNKPGRLNVENAIAAFASAFCTGAQPEELTAAIATFEGVQRRFDYHWRSPEMILIDDYAHHPAEIEATVRSIKELYPHRKVTGVFQPHLYSRTRDFASDFAKSLSLLDRLILLDIYPARELPMEGVTSEIILRDVTIVDKRICTKESLLSTLQQTDFDLLLMMGAGDIDTLIAPVKAIIKNKLGVE